MLPAMLLNKDFNSQIPDVQFNNTTLKQVALAFDGKIGDTSWTWDAHAPLRPDQERGGLVP